MTLEQLGVLRDARDKLCGACSAVECETCYVPRLIEKYEKKATETAPVVHGYWKQNPNMPTQYSCSVCRRQIEDMMCNPQKHFPYCHCGAKMDQKED